MRIYVACGVPVCGAPLCHLPWPCSPAVPWYDYPLNACRLLPVTLHPKHHKVMGADRGRALSTVNVCH